MQPARLPLTALLFDIGNTLIDARGIAAAALEETIEQLADEGLVDEPAAFAAAYAQAAATTFGLDINHLYSGLEILRTAQEKRGREAGPWLLGRFLGVYRPLIRARLIPDRALADLFQRLKQAGFKIGIISDGTTVEQIEQLYLTGLLPFVDALSISQDIGVEKPDPRLFNHALRSVGSPRPDRVLVVGDNIERDIRGGQVLGLKTALVTRYLPADLSPPRQDPPDLIVKTVLDLEGRIEYDRDERN